MCLELSDHSEVKSKKIRGQLSSGQAGPGDKKETLYLSPLCMQQALEPRSALEPLDLALPGGPQNSAQSIWSPMSSGSQEIVRAQPL